MDAFHSARAAKEFLISKTVAEAQRETVPLSDVERKMLYFSETGWTLPDMMAVSDAFDREYDQDEYEKKIANIIRNTDKYTRKESRAEYDAWWNAIRFLKQEDHYILVMVSIAGLRPAGDQLRLFFAGLGVATCFLVWGLLSAKYQVDFSKYLPSGNSLFSYTWVTGVCLVVCYYLVRFVLGEKKTNEMISRMTERVSRIYRRKS